MANNFGSQLLRRSDTPSVPVAEFHPFRDSARGLSVHKVSHRAQLLTAGLERLSMKRDGVYETHRRCENVGETFEVGRGSDPDQTTRRAIADWRRSVLPTSRSPKSTIPSVPLISDPGRTECLILLYYHKCFQLCGVWRSLSISTEGRSSSHFLLAASFSRGDFIPQTNQQTTSEAFSAFPFHYYLPIRSTVYWIPLG